jgi:hypothetical protein
MNSLEQLQKIIEQAPEEFESKMPDIEKKIFKDVSLLLKDLKVSSSGKIETSVENLKLINEIKSKLGKIVVSKEYSNLVNKFVSNIPSISNFQKSTSGLSADTCKMMLEVAKNQIDKTLEGLIGSGYKQEVVSKLYNTLLTNVTTGGSYSDLTEQLRNQLIGTEEKQGMLSKYAKTYVTDTLGQFAGQGNKMIADSLKSEWFEYVGSNLTTTREFCEHLTKKRYVHISEFPMLLKGKIDGHKVKLNQATGLPMGMKDDTTVDNFIMNRGGWNCGHELIPVNELAVPEAVRDKIASINKPIKPIKTEEQKADIQKRWSERKKLNEEIKNISELIPDARKFVAEYGVENVKSVFAAVKSKLSGWENMSLEQQLKKAKFEIQWIEDNKKYDTWEVAKVAYQKQYDKIENLIAKENIKSDISHSFDYATTTKSVKIKALANEINKMLANDDVSISELQQKAKLLNAEVSKLEATKAARQSKKFGLDESNYTKARKDAAMWAKTSEDADKKVRETLEQIWENSTNEEKTAAYYYTSGSSYVNEPLRGLPYYGNKGRDSQKDTDNLTNLINKSSYDFDIWVQRGTGTINVEKTFGINLNNTDKIEVKKLLLGKVGIEPAFASCGNSKGAGFSSQDVIYNIYCPRGTKMLYCEPFSAYGGGNKGSKNGLNWDGKAQAKKIGYEAEILLQRSTKFRVTKVEYSNYKWYIDLDVIGQM